jgi:alanyl-tRNA synthetase
VVVLFGNAGNNARVLFTKSKDNDVPMDQLLKPALQVLGTTAGGGNDSLAQGGGVQAEQGQVQTAIQRAKKLAIARI